MGSANLTWFRLRFPRDLTENNVLAALSAFSGLPRSTTLIFDLAATSAGIEHRLAVTPASQETITGSLRAAIPSLSLDTVETPSVSHTHRLMWQLSPSGGVIRNDEPASIASALLASFFPLNEDELVRLTWTLRPGPRPQPDLTQDSRREGRARAMRAKLALPGLSGYGELSVSASRKQRTALLFNRTGTALHSLSTPYGHLISDPVWWGWLMRLFAQRGRYYSVKELCAVIGWPIDNPDLPGLELGAAKRLIPSTKLPEKGRLLGYSNVAGLKRPVAITPSAATRGTYLLGPTGTGKTSLIKSMVMSDIEAGRGFAVVETNGDLVKDLCDLIPAHRIKDVVLIDPTDRDYAVGFNPFAGSSDPSLVADQIGELFQRLWQAYFGPRTAQLAHMALLTLARHPGSTLIDLPRLFLDPVFRASLIAGLDDPLGLEIDWRWYDSLKRQDAATVIAPLLNKVRQFASRTSIRGIVGQAEPKTSMKSIMAEGRILLVHLPKGLIGAETAKLLGCLILTTLWQAATERAQLPLAERRPFGLFVDEVQDLASAPIPWDEMFAQGRKYGLSVTAAHQNLEQIDRDLREVILANARSKAVFALSASDARIMEKLFAPSLTASDLQALDAYSIAAIVALDDGSLARPVTLATPEPPKPIGSADLVLVASRSGYGRQRREVEAALRQHSAAPRRSTTAIGRKARSTA